MDKTKRKKRKAFVEQDICVSCGSCVKVCPLGAIQIVKGIMAEVDMNKCVGCGKCAKECPASIITIQEVEEEYNEKKLV
ncbi:4Fe-4S dicluster domain-containing protein [bacterium 1XD42-8]|jgi:ferredoxin|nr:4Fe-4S dicluster domain-containing protein [Lachnospiraceae bacterium]RKJ49577.1 4Fe-4S dicluster domain-containing protein [bacterium 1XD42-8]